MHHSKREVIFLVSNDSCVVALILSVLLTLNVWCEDTEPPSEESERTARIIVTATGVECMVTDLGIVTEDLCWIGNSSSCPTSTQDVPSRLPEPLFSSNKIVAGFCASCFFYQFIK